MARRSISRRSVHTTTSKRPAASAADPLIALERAERAAYRKFSDASMALDRAEETFRLTHGRSPAADSESEMIAALDDAQVDAENFWDESVQRMIDTPATTLPGLIVKLRHIDRELDEGDTVNDLEDAMIASALADAERLAAAGEAHE